MRCQSGADKRGHTRAVVCWEIVSPLGEILAGPDFEGECVLVAELDMDDIARGKFDFDVVGHYARPDVFQLIVNETPAVPVVFSKD